MIEAATDSDERLRRLEAVTDAALSHLDVDELLAELLERIRDLLHVDTAVILLLDPHARQLVASAATGLDESFRLGARVPVGRGFAGRIARDRKPVIVDDATEESDTSPLIRGRGIRSLLGVPIYGGGELAGVLHVGSMRPRAFNADDVRLLEMVADRASVATHTRAGTVDRDTALALQRSLLPTALAEVPGVEMAARYLPGHDSGVGGDWYDVFTLPSGWLGVVVGDVSGHGLQSAVVMGRLRSALRAYALVCADPADALVHLDAKVHHFETGNLATVLYAMIPPERDSIHVSVAGHPRPVLVDAAGHVELLRAPADVPLGMGRPSTRRRTTVVDFPPGALLVCYTDGLIERRRESIDVGLDRLRATVWPGEPDEVCTALMLSVGAERPSDDTALLAIRRIGPPPAPEPRVLVDAAFDRAGVASLRRRVADAAERHGMTEEAADDFIAAVNEVMTNAIRHGGGTGMLRLLGDGRLVCEVRDHGGGFPAADFLARRERPIPSSTGGMGLWIAQQTSHALEIESTPAGTLVRITAAG
ncbi:SpoIIE family protein phosphatase [Asanoa sp. WMMD1127]|uniref:SpoIIE family protein phosphatase n=1 Tax=Asanoa sp. WMMD1127 TaxID=3016107 RepID=UPI00241637CD|nr:SpoIIE family protein phosphatase [Asanoa sp. WMMD1127]MDG4825627.1 SpoIIE family protein phosphatase [Asanoa sp. WMMD1127]